MLDKLKQVEDRYEELCARAEQPALFQPGRHFLKGNAGRKR